MADGKVVIDVILNDGSVAKGIANIDGIGKSGERAGLGIGKMVTALGLVKVASAALGVVKSSLDSAISRFDTMQKFPKVMAALGFSSEDSSKSIKKLSDGIDGLPTKLDDVVASTQQLTSITGDLDKSTNTVLALNNAFLASGASTEDANRGMQQYNQMLSSGTVDLESWKTLQETMPLALQKTAEAMGYVGKSAQRDLYAALKNGTVTFDQFQDKLIELGTGTGTLASLAKENSLGIATSFGNLKNAVAKNVANIITKVDDITKKMTGKSIAQNVDSLKVIINSTFGEIIKSMDSVIPVIDKVKKSMNFTLVGYIIKDAIAIFSTFWKVFTGGVGKEKSINVISGVFKTLNGVIEQVLQNIGLFLDVLSTSKVAEILGQAFKNLRETIVTVVNSLKGMFTYLSSQADSDKVIKILVSAVKIAAEAFLFLTEKVKELAPVIMGVLGKSITWIVKNIGMIKTAAVAAAAGFLAFKTVTVTMAAASAAIKAFNATMIVLKVAMAVGKDIELLKFALNNMASASKLAAVAQKALNLVLSINPVVAIVTGVIALVAAIIYLWKTNEGFRNAIIVIWEAVKGAFIGAKDAIVGAWNGMTTWFSNLWSGIKSAFSTGISAIASLLSTAWTGIQSAATTSWNTIKSAAISVWSGIVSGIMAIVQPFIIAFTAIWNSMSTGLSLVWDGIRTYAQGAWELIKAVIMGPVLILLDLITLNFTQLGADISMIWESIKSAATMMWNGMMAIIVGVVTAISSSVTLIISTLSGWIQSAWSAIVSFSVSLWNSLKDGVISAVSSLYSGTVNLINRIRNIAISIFNGLVSGTIALFNSLVSGAIGLWNGLRSGVVAIANGIVSGAQSAWNSLVSGVTNAVNSVKNVFNSLANINLEAAGRAIIDGFLGGLKSSFESVKSFVGGIADWIRDHKGPIQYDRKLLIPAGNAIMSSLNKGLQDKFKAVKATISGVANSLSKNMMVGIEVGISKNSNLPQLAMQGVMSDIVLPSVSAESVLSSRVSGIGASNSVTNNYYQTQSNNAVLDAVNKLANRPIVTNIDVDGTNVARATSKAMTKQQYYDERTDSRMRGVLI